MTPFALKSELGHNYTLWQQPVCTPDGVLIGSEALFRAKRFTFLQHYELLPLAEKSGNAARIDRFSIREAIGQLSTILKVHLAFKVSVNVFPQSIYSDPDLASFIAQTLKAASVPPEALRIEIVEGGLRDDLEPIKGFINEMHANRVQVYLDDVCTKDSKLHHLLLPVDGIKLDRSYTEMLDESEAGAVIVAKVVEAAQALGKAVVGEGVECRRHLEKLQSLDVTAIQGYHFYRPMPVNELLTILERQQRQQIGSDFPFAA